MDEEEHKVQETPKKEVIHPFKETKLVKKEDENPSKEIISKFGKKAKKQGIKDKKTTKEVKVQVASTQSTKFKVKVEDTI